MKPALADAELLPAYVSKPLTEMDINNCLWYGRLWHGFGSQTWLNCPKLQGTETHDLNTQCSESQTRLQQAFQCKSQK
jgi:hypothetical protein